MVHTNQNVLNTTELVKIVTVTLGTFYHNLKNTNMKSCYYIPVVEEAKRVTESKHSFVSVLSVLGPPTPFVQTMFTQAEGPRPSFT